jgi:hypothetical protein
MSRARIVDGIWSRKVPKKWQQNGIARADIFKTTLADPRLREAEFVLEGGSRVVISVKELQRVLEGGRDHHHEKIWGPFNIDPVAQTIDGQSVQMRIIA